MLKKILIGFAVVVGVFVVIVLTRPNTLAVTRSAVVPASPEVAFAAVADFKRWAAWSPWEKLDPAMKKSYEGEPSGSGAIYRWAGNDDVGEGRMTITEAKPGQELTIRLEFLKPWTATNTTSFSFVASGTGTRVTWSMTGEQSFMAKAFGLFMDMDAMIGADFEKGLSGLAAVVAAPPAPAPVAAPATP